MAYHPHFSTITYHSFTMTYHSFIMLTLTHHRALSWSTTELYHHLSELCHDLTRLYCDLPHSSTMIYHRALLWFMMELYHDLPSGSIMTYYRVILLPVLELYYDRGNHHEFTSLVRELARPGELGQSVSYDFEFVQVEKPYESYTGANVKLRYDKTSKTIHKFKSFTNQINLQSINCLLNFLVSVR